MTDRLLSTADAARYLGVSESFLERDRIDGGRIPFVRLGKRIVRYRIAELDAYVSSRIRQSTGA